MFDRDRLVILSGKTPAARLDQLVLNDAAMETLLKSPAVAATYRAEDTNAGFADKMSFTGEAGRQATLTELSSRKTGRKARLVAGCRDESHDRFAKTYSAIIDKEAPRTVKLQCLEYMLSTKGGRTCR